MLPTCIELAGADYPVTYRKRDTETLEGLSLTSTFRDQALEREMLFFEMNGNRAVRTEKWKAVSRQGLSKEQRYQVKIPLEQLSPCRGGVDHLPAGNDASDTITYSVEPPLFYKRHEMVYSRLGGQSRKRTA